MPRFATPRRFVDRESKARFAYEKYREILKGSVLDVGADACHLKKHLPKEVVYKGIGFGKGKDIIRLDLEKGRLPFPAKRFDCVLCLDVLEHLENIHEVFDELCRVSKRWVVVSLPNPWNDFMRFLRKRAYKKGRNIKFYGLTREREEDRHKWFFSAGEAEDFVRYRADKNGMKVVDVHVSNPGWREGLSWLERLSLKVLVREGVRLHDLFVGPSWYVLKKKGKRKG